MDKTNFDCIVIGAGNGGLMAALRLLKNNKKVLVLERELVPGGYATSFKRGRFEFEASLHELCEYGDKDNHGELYDILEEFDLNKEIEFIKIPEAFTVYDKNGKQYSFPTGIDNFINKMEEYVPSSRPSMEKYFALAKECTLAMKYLNASHGKADTKVLMKEYPNFMNVAAYNIKTVLDALKMPSLAQELLTTYWSYLGTPSKKMSFVHYTLMLYYYVVYSPYIPKLRSHAISLALANKITSLGGEIYYGCEVKEIIYQNGEVQGVKLVDGKTYYSHHIISNASPHSVFGNLLTKDVPEEQLKIANSRELSGRGFAIYLGLNKSKEELGLNNYSYFIYDSLDSDKQYEMMKSLDSTAQVVVCLNSVNPTCSPAGTTILYFTSLLFSDAFDKEVTKENYYELKDRIAKNYIERFEKTTGIKIQDAIEEIEVATPSTFYHYTASRDGSIYGYSTEGLDNMLPRLMTMYDEKLCKGLRFVGGHSIRSSGYNSAYISGDIMAKLTLGDMKEDK